MLALDAGDFDAGLCSRLERLAAAAFDAAQVCISVARRDLEIPRQDGARRPPPFELCPHRSRRGPKRLWGRLDVAVAELDSAAAGTDLRTIARAYHHLGDIAVQLAAAIAAADGSRVQQTKRRQ